MAARFKRVSELERPKIVFQIDGVDITALEGDTILTAVMSNGGYLRVTEFEQRRRAGFCLMGACNDCVVWTEDAQKVRACSAFVSPGLRIFTRVPEDAWPTVLT